MVYYFSFKKIRNAFVGIATSLLVRVQKGE